MSNSLCHFELMALDPAKSKAFYQKVFDWIFDENAYPGYTMIRPGKELAEGL